MVKDCGREIGTRLGSVECRRGDRCYGLWSKGMGDQDLASSGEGNLGWVLGSQRECTAALGSGSIKTWGFMYTVGDI